jgi:Rad3-related DNA helicase
MIDEKTIEKQVDDVVKEHFPIGFTFRPHQKEAIITTITNWLTGTDNEIISAPTGSGKSITAMIIAAVLTKYHGKTGYILVSDLNLIDQYSRDIEKYFPNWAVIKGQQTYICDKNGMDFRGGVCKMKGCKTYTEIYTKFPECACTCKYIQDRIKAMGSTLLVCSYSFWLIQQNMVRAKLGPEAPFDKRDFTICDEAHKIVSIVQNHFSPRMGYDDINKFRIISENVDNDTTVIDDLTALKDVIWKTDDKAEILDLLEKYVDTLGVIEDDATIIIKGFTNKTDSGEELSQEDRKLAYVCEWANEHISSFEDYIKIIKTTTVENIIKNMSEDMKTLTFNCIDESYLMGKCFHAHCNKKMFMSATIGDPNAFARDCGINAFHNIEIPSTFDFTNSPIFYVQDYKLSYKEKEYTLPKIIELIEYTVRMYAGYRGIIQTGSYQFAKQLYNNVSQGVRDRLIIYDDSTEKKNSLELFKLYPDKILVGPSLIEGLSFDDDLCRFQIIMKVPYPSLKDNFVAAKQKINQEWYSNTTAISILQGVGRGVRSEHDWCVTFIFDGCFTYLMNKSRTMFPNEFVNRIQVIPPNAIVK